MTQLANDTDLKYAEIDLCLFHVNSGILLQLWKGVIQNFTSDGTPIFPVTCSDGFFQIMNQYPERQISRQCWKTYNDGVNCPWATKGRSASAVTAAGGDPASCDYYLESANGCQVHGMAPVLRRASGRSAGRRHQGRFHRLPRLRPQHRHRNVDHLGHDLGPGAAGDLVQQRRQSALCVHGQRADGGVSRRIRLRRLARHSRRRPSSVDSPASYGRHERGRLPLRGGAHGRWLHLARASRSTAT